LTENTNGLLPNDRTHQIKAFAFYNVAPEWTVGGNLLVASGRPLSCFGSHPSRTDYIGNYNYCFGATDKTNVPVVRGSLGNLPTDMSFDLNVAYRPDYVKGLTLKTDIFNLFNRVVAQRLNETYNTQANTVSPDYGRVMSYTAPRAVRFTVEYNHAF